MVNGENRARIRRWFHHKPHEPESCSHCKHSTVKCSCRKKDSDGSPLISSGKNGRTTGRNKLDRRNVRVTRASAESNNDISEERSNIDSVEQDHHSSGVNLSEESILEGTPVYYLTGRKRSGLFRERSTLDETTSDKEDKSGTIQDKQSGKSAETDIRETKYYKDFIKIVKKQQERKQLELQNTKHQYVQTMRSQLNSRAGGATLRGLEHNDGGKFVVNRVKSVGFNSDIDIHEIQDESSFPKYSFNRQK